MQGRLIKAGRMASFMTALSLLSACYAFKPPQQDRPNLEALIQDFAECFRQGDEAQCERSVSFPFYVDGHATSRSQFMQIVPLDDTPISLPEFSVDYRVLPVEDLNVYWPQFWDLLQKQTGFDSEKDRLFLLPISIRSAERKPESGWLMLRRDAQGLRIAGLIDG